MSTEFDRRLIEREADMRTMTDALHDATRDVVALRLRCSRREAALRSMVAAYDKFPQSLGMCYGGAYEAAQAALKEASAAMEAP